MGNSFVVSRRGFIKSVAAAGAFTALYGCAKAKSGGLSEIESNNSNVSVSDPVYRYGTTAHNCGGKCMTKAQVVDGRIVRFLTDDSQAAWDGTSSGPENRNCSQARACSRCRSYRFRLYHPGRLQYPLKQTKKRGDLSGFQRISWENALKEISAAYYSVLNKYGVEAIHEVYACGNDAGDYQASSYGVFNNISRNAKDKSTQQDSPVLPLLGGATPFANNYSYHQAMAVNGKNAYYTGYQEGDSNFRPTANDIAGAGKTIVLWGSNALTTSNPSSFVWVKAIEDMKKRDPESKVFFIGPEFVDTGVTLADKWIRMRPYTDTAVVMGILHYLITNTVKADGTICEKPLLDIDYIDTMVYGFFDSPEYYIDKREGAGKGRISLTPVAGYTKVNEVPAGRSLSAYVLGGSDKRLTLMKYGNSNYTSKIFSKGGRTRNMSVCSYNAPADTKYMFKKDFKAAKTPEWASKISGVPMETIIELAKIYSSTLNPNPVYSEYCGATQKQAEGCINLIALQSLMIATKRWGRTAEGFSRGAMGAVRAKAPNDFGTGDVHPNTWGRDKGNANIKQTPVPSCTAWHNGIKFAFGKELKKNGYVPNIPDWNTKTGYTGDIGQVYHNDGAIKALIQWERNSDGTVKEDAEGYYVPQKNGAKVKPSGFRFILNTGGNIPINQHMNSVDSMLMFEALPATYGVNNVKGEDAFYMVCFDNFMSPSARWSDYVLPAKTSWEQEDMIGLSFGNTVYVDSVIAGPGESISTWDLGRDWLNTVDPSGEKAKLFTGLDKHSTFKDVVRKTFEDKITKDPKSPHYGKTWDEYVAKPFVTASPSTAEVTSISMSPVRQAFEDYVKQADFSKPFNMFITTPDEHTAGAGYIGGDQFVVPPSDPCPQQSGRFHVFSGGFKWRYEHLFNKWHKHLPQAMRGQPTKDLDGQSVIYEIPMYFNYEDYFMEAYGLPDTDKLKGRYLLTTTHDRYRAHSSHGENPLLRELTHRTVGGGLYSGDDANEYAMIGTAAENLPEGSLVNIPEPNDAIAKNLSTASYTEIWINPDNKDGIKDGDLIEVWNEIGAVRGIARASTRCVPGFIGLHQGCWFNPLKDSKGDYIRNASGQIIDFGGCCNTLMASKPSRFDHGNGQQSAMVKVKKVNK